MCPDTPSLHKVDIQRSVLCPTDSFSFLHVLKLTPCTKESASNHLTSFPVFPCAETHSLHNGISKQSLLSLADSLSSAEVESLQNGKCGQSHLSLADSLSDFLIENSQTAWSKSPASNTIPNRLFSAVSCSEVLGCTKQGASKQHCTTTLTAFSCAKPDSLQKERPPASNRMPR